MTGVTLNFCATVGSFMYYLPKHEGFLTAKLHPSHRLLSEQTIFS